MVANPDRFVREQREICRYKNRRERCEFMVERFRKYIRGNVLNLGGGGEKILEKIVRELRLSNISTIEVDIAGNPDLKLNLETDLPLPFEDKEFSTVIATDVLEHLDNLHEVFDEMVRVSSEFVIISLPNCIKGSLVYWRNLLYSNNRKEYGRFMKFYGLPFEKPLDRHKWFFNYEEVVDFFMYKSLKYDLDIKEIVHVELEKPKIKKVILLFARYLLGDRFINNLTIMSTWIVLKKMKG